MAAANHSRQNSLGTDKRSVQINIDNFAEYLKTYSAKTQFVVVTHRKGTMTRCDALYGVAMEEKGVSKMMSVKLADAV